MKPYCFAIDQIIPSEKASLHPLDIGLIRGYGVFDFFRTVNYQPIFLKEYLIRFQRSAVQTHLSLNYSIDELEEIVLGLIEKNDLKQGGIRMVMSGGVSDNHFSPENGSLFIFCETLNFPSLEKYTSGVNLLLHDYIRPIPEVKTTNYAFPVYLSADWKRQEAEDVLYHHDNIISESSRSNVFIIKNKEILTPRSNILKGITRKRIMDISGKVIEKDISLEEVFEADEIFMSSTTKRLLPVTRIDGKKIGKGKPGNITKELIDQFHQLERKMTE